MKKPDLNDITKCLVDTNVPVTANEAIKGGDTPSCCVEGCKDAIRHVMNHAVLVVDDANEILGEYTRNLNSRDKQGLGYKFLKWVYQNTWDRKRIERVKITPEKNSYKEFPTHEGLRNFDPSDRKFVATACAHTDPAKPPILQATDSKWLWCEFMEAFEEVGLSIWIVPDCERFLRKNAEKKKAKNK